MASDSIRQKVWDEVVSRLSAIVAGATYWTTPSVFDTESDAWKGDATYSVWAEYGGEVVNMDNWTLSGGGPVGLEINVHCLVRHDGGAVALPEMATRLLQDVRNALNADIKDYKTDTGADLSGFDEATTDEGALSYDGKALVTQPVVFTYNAGPTW